MLEILAIGCLGIAQNFAKLFPRSITDLVAIVRTRRYAAPSLCSSGSGRRRGAVQKCEASACGNRQRDRNREPL